MMIREVQINNIELWKYTALQSVTSPKKIFRLYLQRLIFLGILYGCYLLYRDGHTDYVTFISFIAGAFSFFPITITWFQPKTADITEYYVWGWLPITKRIPYENIISVREVKAHIRPYDDMYYGDDSGFSLLAWFSEPKYHVQLWNIKYDVGAGEKNVRVDLSSEEYKSMRAKAGLYGNSKRR
jgi:hypothetical protein